MLQLQGLDDKHIMFVLVFITYPDSPASKSELKSVIDSLESIVTDSNRDRVQPILDKLKARHTRMR
jgi:hypothetical protein